MVDKEACKQHERNNQNWSQCDSKLLVREDGTKDQGIAGRGIVYQENYYKETWELVPYGIESNCIIDNASEYDRGQQARWEF